MGDFDDGYCPVCDDITCDDPGVCVVCGWDLDDPATHVTDMLDPMGDLY